MVFEYQRESVRQSDGILERKRRMNERRVRGQLLDVRKKLRKGEW